MREIKFRTWSVTYQKILYVHTLKFEEDIAYGIDIEDGRYIQPSPIKKKVLMQYTGFKDKNCVEIYEGDIIDVTGKYDDYIVYITVLWDEEECRWAYQKDENNDNEIGSLWEILDVKSEIVGNIYQNPELLK